MLEFRRSRKTNRAATPVHNTGHPRHPPPPRRDEGHPIPGGTTRRDDHRAATHPVTLGVALGLLAGKLLGITGFTWLAVRLGWGRLPRATGWRHVVGLSAVAGIGFTVALFIAGLAFTDPLLADQAKLGIFAGSLLAGLLGYFVLRLTPPDGGQDTAEDA